MARGSGDGQQLLAAGIVVRDTNALTKLLQSIYRTTPVATPDAAGAMARAVRQLTGADYGLGIAAFPTSGPEVPTAAVVAEHRYGRHVARGADRRRQCTREEFSHRNPSGHHENTLCEAGA